MGYSLFTSVSIGIALSAAAVTAPASAATYTADFSSSTIDPSLGIIGDAASVSSGGGYLTISYDQASSSENMWAQNGVGTNFQISGNYVASVTLDMSDQPLSIYPTSYFDAAMCGYSTSSPNGSCISNFRDPSQFVSNPFFTVDGTYMPQGQFASASTVHLRIARQGSTVTESIALGNGAFNVVASLTDSRLAGPVSFGLTNLYNGTAGGSGSVRFSNFTITQSSVPEPASWAMMLAGFGLVGSTVRRRKSAGCVA